MIWVYSNILYIHDMALCKFRKHPERMISHILVNTHSQTQTSPKYMPRERSFFAPINGQIERGRKLTTAPPRQAAKALDDDVVVAMLSSGAWRDTYNTRTSNKLKTWSASRLSCARLADAIIKRSAKRETDGWRWTKCHHTHLTVLRYTAGSSRHILRCCCCSCSTRCDICTSVLQTQTLPEREARAIIIVVVV